MKCFATLGLVAIATLTAAGCSTSTTPDEFRVVRKAPLILPPEFNLRPPSLGEARPQELSPDAQARVAVFGADIGKDASEGEKLFIKAAGGDASDRSVRSQVDFDNAQILRKNRGFADMIMNFGGGAAKEPLVDPAAEAERLRAEQESLKDVTGGGKVIIQQKHTSKLPGL